MTSRKGIGMRKLLVAGGSIAVSIALVGGVSDASHGPNHGLCDNPTIKVQEGDNVTFGTAGNDVIKGTTGPDTIHGGGGHDKLCGNKGPDRILGDGGDDKMAGGHANDRLIGENGDDSANGMGGTSDFCRAEREKKC
jgi:Ca2+-binding RTX toxin-like protein